MPEVKPLPKESPVVGKVDSAVVVGVKPKTKNIPRDDGTANRESSVDTQSVTTGTAPDGSPTRTQTATTTDAYKTQFVKVYQDAGVIGASMLSMLVIIAILGALCVRILRMYRDMLTNRDAAETKRLEYFDKLTDSVTLVSTAITHLRSDLAIDKTERDNKIKNMQQGVDRVCKLLEDYVFDRRQAS